jgi:3-methyladenine DNA glycosylase AlkC
MPTADELLGAREVAELADVLTAVAPDRSWSTVRQAGSALDGQALSDRARAVRDALLADGPAGYREFQALIRVALEDAAFTGWMIWPVSEAVATLATAATEAPLESKPKSKPKPVKRKSPEPAAFEAGLALLAELTPRLTGEFALRTFLNADLDRTLAVVRTWTSHPHEHVRRLASEGTRPRLPWAKRVPVLTARPEATIPVLDGLYRDACDYVRRSVANHLNDLSRADPALAVRTAKRWLAEPSPSAPKETAQLVRHSMRTLIKQGDPGALTLLGFAPPTGLLVEGPTLSATTVQLGDGLTFGLSIVNPTARSVRVSIDYVVHYRKANATLAPKVFKLTTRTLGPGETVDLVRRQPFVPISTRRHYPGEHAIELQVNGASFGRTTFLLVAP